MPVEKPTFREALQFWLKLGFISFGGPAGQIAIMHTFVVEQKKWVSDARFLHALNYCMLLPGPEAQQLAIYLGWLLHGVRGGLAAGILFVLPSVFVLLGLSVVYVLFGSVPWVYALFYGLKPAVVAIVLLALLKIGKKSLHTLLHILVAAASFAAIYFFNIPFPYIILSAILLALLTLKLLPDRLKQQQTSIKTSEAENEYYLNASTIVPGTGFRPGRVMRQLAVALALWLLPLGLLYLSSSHFAFWRTMSLFFTKAAFVTFGGAYAVLPYVAQVSVEKLEWLSKLEMIDGLALGETTPGPLIMVLAFVGFMGGYNHFGTIAAGTTGLLLTSFYTFLPCFLFILVGAPLIERTQDDPRVKAVLSVVTAAVVGVILNLTLYFGTAVVFPDGVALAKADWLGLLWVLVSVLALYRLKINIVLWIFISALAGLLHHLVVF